MAVTQTFVTSDNRWQTTVTGINDNRGAQGNRKTWELQFLQPKIVVTGDSFTYETPKIKTKFEGPSSTGKNYRSTEVYGEITIDNNQIISYTKKTGDYYKGFRWASPEDAPNDVVHTNSSTGTYYWINKRNSIIDGIQTLPHEGITIPTFHIFNSDNKNKKELNIIFRSEEIYLYTTGNVDTLSPQSWYENYSVTSYNIGKVVLNAPPKINNGSLVVQPTTGYSSFFPQNLTTITVPTTMTAQYGGDISTVMLSVGTKSTTISAGLEPSYSTSLSIVPNSTGNQVPIRLTAVDSRGQTTVKTLGTINIGYPNPSVSIEDIKRINSSTYLPDEEEGTNALLIANFSFQEGAKLSLPTVTIKKPDNSPLASTVTWYSNYSDSNGFSNAIPSTTDQQKLYAKIQANLETNTDYTITVTPIDGNNTSGTPVTQKLPAAYFTVDFLAGGRGVAFGRPATTEGFLCGMNSTFANDLLVSNLKLGSESIITKWSDIPAVTTAKNGLMGSADKTKLDRTAAIIQSGYSYPVTQDKIVWISTSANGYNINNFNDTVAGHLTTIKYTPSSSGSIAAGGTASVTLTRTPNTTYNDMFFVSWGVSDRMGGGGIMISGFPNGSQPYNISDNTSPKVYLANIGTSSHTYSTDTEVFWVRVLIPNKS